MLFHSWKATFDCNRNAKVKTAVDFGLANRLLKDGSTEIQLQICNLCTFLEESLNEWLYHVSEKRNSFVNLNYFTTEQMVILRRELAKLNEGIPPDNKVYHLLDFVKQDCNESDLKKTWKVTNKELVDNDLTSEKASKDKKLDDDYRQIVNDTILDSNHELIRQLEEYGYSENLAKKAVLAIGDDFDKGGMRLLIHVHNCLLFV